jgi:hypothetical protein
MLSSTNPNRTVYHRSGEFRQKPFDLFFKRKLEKLGHELIECQNQITLCQQCKNEKKIINCIKAPGKILILIKCAYDFHVRSLTFRFLNTGTIKRSNKQ